uniref:RING-type domain-containing protein n=1 Tax=Amphimedon queenslandica TaxID=400682 RepID=A0A1X7TYC5_AMPQE
MAEEENKDGGYDCDFLEEPPDDLICPICLLPPRKPHLISCCGRKLCHFCVNRVKQAGDPCPCCREKQYVIVIDKIVERQVLDLKVYCKNKSKGCHWNGELRDLEKHTESCHVTSAELLAEQKKIIEKQAEDIKRLEEKNKKMTKEMENLSLTKKEGETAMKRSIATLNVENEKLKQQLREIKQSLPQPTPLANYHPMFPRPSHQFLPFPPPHATPPATYQFTPFHRPPVPPPGTHNVAQQFTPFPPPLAANPYDSNQGICPRCRNVIHRYAKYCGKCGIYIN